MTTATPKLKWRDVAITLIDVPREYERQQPNEDADRSLAASIKLSGVHQPLTVIPKEGGRFLLIKGTRRLAAAEENGLEKVPVVVNTPPAGLSKPELKKYRDKLREFLFLRQDLTPSQRWSVVSEAKERFRLSNKEIAALIGFDPGTLSNWAKIAGYAPPIKAAIDAGELTLFHAQALQDLKASAQVKVFKELRGEFQGRSGRQIQSIVRKRFNPAKFPELWANPKTAEKKIAERPAKRRRLIQARQSTFTEAERNKLTGDLDLLQTEEKENAAELKRLNRLLQLVSPIHRAVSADGELIDYVASKYPERVLALETFSEHGY